MAGGVSTSALRSFSGLSLSCFSFAFYFHKSLTKGRTGVTHLLLMIICCYGRWLCFSECLRIATGFHLGTLPFNCIVIVPSVLVLCRHTVAHSHTFLFRQEVLPQVKRNPCGPCSHSPVLSHCSQNLPLIF